MIYTDNMLANVILWNEFSVYHDVKDVDFLIVVLIVRDVHRIVIVVANLHYYIGPIMKASISRTVPHHIQVFVVIVVVDIVNNHRLLNDMNKMMTTTTMITYIMMTTNSPMTATIMMVWGTMNVIETIHKNKMMIPLKLQ